MPFDAGAWIVDDTGSSTGNHQYQITGIVAYSNRPQMRSHRHILPGQRRQIVPFCLCDDSGTDSVTGHHSIPLLHCIISFSIIRISSGKDIKWNLVKRVSLIAMATVAIVVVDTLLNWFYHFLIWVSWFWHQFHHPLTKNETKPNQTEWCACRWKMKRMHPKSSWNSVTLTYKNTGLYNR